MRTNLVTEDTYTKLITLRDERGAGYRLIDHPPEGRTEIASGMRGNDLRHAAKCIILMVKMGRKTTKHVLAIVPASRIGQRIGLHGDYRGKVTLDQLQESITVTHILSELLEGY
jgi:hypothetical protein